jgi:hypothetical protein
LVAGGAAMTGFAGQENFSEKFSQIPFEGIC